MKLFFRTYGHGQPMLILHGLFGQSDNWNTLAKHLGETGFCVYAIDLRNHGLSPHSYEMNYQAMGDDILELINAERLDNVVLMGHSMGGKVAMKFAIQHADKLSKLIVVDIAPKYYSAHHTKVIEGLQEVDFNVVKSRKEAEAVLSHYIEDFGTKQFLLKNIYWKNETTLSWRFNLNSIVTHIENIGEAINSSEAFEVQTLFIRGEKSKYILDDDMDDIQRLFPRATLETIENAGHWVHAEKAKEFFECVAQFTK